MTAYSVHKHKKADRLPQPPDWSKQRQLFRRMARNMDNTSALVIDDDDMVQEALLFAVQNQWIDQPGYMMRLARLRVLSIIQSDKRQRHNAIALADDCELDDDMERGWPVGYGACQSDVAQVEEYVSARLMAEAIRRRLKPTAVAAFDLLLSGYRQFEIAQKMEISSARVSQLLRAIRHEASAYLEASYGA